MRLLPVVAVWLAALVAASAQSGGPAPAVAGPAPRRPQASPRRVRPLPSSARGARGRDSPCRPPTPGS